MSIISDPERDGTPDKTIIITPVGGFGGKTVDPPQEKEKTPEAPAEEAKEKKPKRKVVWRSWVSHTKRHSIKGYKDGDCVKYKSKVPKLAVNVRVHDCSKEDDEK